MKADPMFATMKKTGAKLRQSPVFAAECAGMMMAFFSGQISEQDFLAMDPVDRAAIAGLIAGRCAARNPEDMYEALQMMRCN